MNASRLKHKTIKKVHQSWYPGELARDGFWRLDAIEFEDGTVMRFLALETDESPEVIGIYPGRAIDSV